MSKKKADSKKEEPKKQSRSTRVSGLRQRLVQKAKDPSRKSFRLTKKYPTSDQPPAVAGGFALFRQSLSFYRAHKKLLIGLTMVYILLLWLISGLPSQEAYNALKEVLAETSESGIANLSGVGALAAGAVSGFTAAAKTELQQFLTALTGVIFWLVFVWTVRQLQAGNDVTVRQALYNAPAPLVPLMLLILLVAVQLIPASIGVLILAYAFGGAAVVSGVEAMLFSLAAGLLIVLSLYWVVQSLFAMIIVTLPNTYPLTAMSAAKSLVSERRFLIVTRLFMLVLLIALIWICILTPVVLLDIYINTTFIPLVPLTVDLLSAVMLPVGIIYVYRLYRELL
jgi:hypothetical protein